MITIVNYGLGNMASIVNMLKRIGFHAIVSSDVSDIIRADKLILPGVGSFDEGIKRLHESDLLPALKNKVMDQKIPVLGICLGMQMFAQRSEEGSLPGLGWIAGDVVRFKFDPSQKNLKIPHMGWNHIQICKKSRLFEDLFYESRFYFVHSYHVVCKNPEDIAARTVHGYEFVCSFERENIAGVQFHPEKSHKFGMKLLKNFVERF